MSRSERMTSGITNTIAALAVIIVIAAAAVSIIAFQTTSGNATQVTTLTANRTTTLTQGSTTIFVQGSTTTVTQVSTVISTLISVTTVTAATTSAATTTTTTSGASQITVIGQSLFALDFTVGGTTTTFTCASAPSSAYLTLRNTGSASASVTAVSITWMGGNTPYTLSGTCNFGPINSGTETQYIIFPATTRINPSAIAGQAYTGTVTLSTGAQLALSGNWAQ